MGKIRSRPGIVEKIVKNVVITTRTHYTPHQLLELKKCHDDARYFIDTYLTAMTSNGPQSFLTRSYQQTQIRAFTQHSVFCLQPRQSGATALPLAYQLWEAMFHSNTRHGAAFAKQSQAVDGMKLVQFWYDNVPSWLRPGVTRRNQTAVEFDNGSRFIAGTITGKFSHGRSWTTLFADCLAFANEQDQHDFWFSSLASVCAAGRMFITGVPNGPTNTFARVWHQIIQTQNLFFASLQVDPLSVYKQQELDSIRALIGADAYKREYDCEFI